MPYVVRKPGLRRIVPVLGRRRRRRCAPSPRRRAPPRRTSASRRPSARSSCRGRTRRFTPSRPGGDFEGAVAGWTFGAGARVERRERVVLRRTAPPTSASLTLGSGGERRQRSDVHRPHVPVVPVLRPQHLRRHGRPQGRGRLAGVRGAAGPARRLSTRRPAPRGRRSSRCVCPPARSAPGASSRSPSASRPRVAATRSTTCTSIRSCGANNATTARERPPSHDGGR